MSFVFERGSRSDEVRSGPAASGTTLGELGKGEGCTEELLGERRELEQGGEATRAAGEGSGEGPFNDLPRSVHEAGGESGVVARMVLRWPPPRSATARAGLQSLRCFFLSFPLLWFDWRLPCLSMRR